MSAIARNVAQLLEFGIFDSTTGDAKTGATLTTTISKDGGAAVATTNSAAEVGATARYTLQLTSTEMDADVVCIKITGTGVLTTFITVYTDTIAADISVVQADTDDIQTRIPAVLVGGRMDSSVGAMAAGVITATAIASNAIDDDALATDLDTYQADIRVFKDATTDYYEVVYKKNSHPITSGITLPTIQVIKASDGSDLVASTALTQIAATGYYKKDEATNRVSFGNRYIVVVTATIDGSTRTMAVGVGRDG